MRHNLQNGNGFTLIELMIVIAIIAILAAILIPNMHRALGAAKLASCESNEKNLANALALYATDNDGNYPPANSGTAALVPNYLTIIPVCPANGASYVYESSSSSIPVTDYALIQGGGDPHAAYVGGNPPPASWTSACTASTYPCYFGSTGMLTGK